MCFILCNQTAVLGNSLILWIVSYEDQRNKQLRKMCLGFATVCSEFFLQFGLLKSTIVYYKITPVTILTAFYERGGIEPCFFCKNSEGLRRFLQFFVLL